MFPGLKAIKPATELEAAGAFPITASPRPKLYDIKLILLPALGYIYKVAYRPLNRTNHS